MKSEFDTDQDITTYVKRMVSQNKFETDMDIIAYVKDMISQNRVASSLQLFFSLNEEVFKYGSVNADDMVVKLFDLSLANKISSVFPSMPWYGQCAAFDMVVVPSTDGHTNITAKLIDFFKALVNPFALDRLKEPFRKVQTVTPYICGNYVCGLSIPYDPWEMFESS